jgi:hypothetical protein
VVGGGGGGIGEVGAVEDRPCGGVEKKKGATQLRMPDALL